MNEPRIGLLVCSLLQGELDRARANLGLDELPVGIVPCRCYSAVKIPQDRWNVVLDRMLRRCNKVVAVCMNCVARPGNNWNGSQKVGSIEHPDVQLLKVETQGELFMGTEATEAILQERVFILLPGILAQWRSIIEETWKFDRELAREFFAESASRLLFLDTGVPGDWDAELQAMSDYTGLPVQVRKVGTSLFEILLESAISELRFSSEMQHRKEEIRQARRGAADHAVLADFVTGLGSLLDEEDVRQRLTDTLSLLFASDEVEFHTSQSNDMESDESSSTGEIPGCRINKTEDGCGLEIELWQGSLHLGQVSVREPAFPEHIDRVIPMARVTANAAALALSAARLHRREQELADSLKNRVQELDSFVRTASHDLQSPLHTIKGFSELLERSLEGEQSEEVRDCLRFIQQGAEKMRKLIQSLLALSRAESRELKLEETSLDDCLEHALDNLAGLIQEKGARVNRTALPVSRVDGGLIVQLFQNLVGNGIKYCRAEQPEITITVNQRGEETVIGVQDNGIGIEPEFAQQVFEPFKRLHGDGEFEGTGIGLSVCVKIVERHGGRIWADSNPGKGSHFQFTLG